MVEIDDVEALGLAHLRKLSSVPFLTRDLK